MKENRAALDVELDRDVLAALDAEFPPPFTRSRSRCDAARCPASITPGERLVGLHGTMSGDWLGLIWEQEAAGSNPAIPTRSDRCGSWFTLAWEPIQADGAA